MTKDFAGAVLVLALVAIPAGATAQHLAPMVPTAATSRAWEPPPPARWVPGSQALPSAVALDRRLRAAVAPRPSYWLKGGLIGAAVLGGSAALLSFACDGDSGPDCGSNRRKVMLAAIPVGFVIGALIGGNFHPSPSDSAPPSR